MLDRELAYYEDFYSGPGAAHFAKPAVVAFRQYLVRRILRATGAGPNSRVLSIGCGIGDTELLLAPHVAQVTGFDLSPAAIQAATRAAALSGVHNVQFMQGAWQDLSPTGQSFDLVLAIFFLHHLGETQFADFPSQLRPLVNDHGRFYALEPSARRLSGFLGKLLVPRLMKKYQSDDERPLLVGPTAASFHQARFDVTYRWFDFCSTPIAGLFPSWPSAYRLARQLDHALTALPGLHALSSNFELIAAAASPRDPICQ
ncbi:MAG TPA: class I SAM-dependent methyltransferase [Bryobacteraceae bacterium]|nr:class I SAM-dependent methyltransferase [Bryobacteraceae bacterium]